MLALLSRKCASKMGACGVLYDLCAQQRLVFYKLSYILCGILDTTTTRHFLSGDEANAFRNLATVEQYSPPSWDFRRMQTLRLSRRSILTSAYVSFAATREECL